MLATHPTSSAAPSRLLGMPVEDLRLRVQGGEHHGRILRIAAAKCSIGSAAGCTLRLRGEGIEPLHCLILSGKNGTVIRRNSPRTYLNGGPFEDAALHPGDILRLGPVELAVVACPQPDKPTSQPNSAAPGGSGHFEQAAKVEQRIEEEVSRAGDQEQAEQQRLARELEQTTEQLRIAREQLASARQLQEQATSDSHQATEQLREQYAQRLERILEEQRQERTESREREERIQSELRLAGERAEELTSRLGVQDAASERQVKEHVELVERLQDEMRKEQSRHQQERAESVVALQELQEALAQLRAETDAQRNELLVRERSCEGATDQIRQLESQLKDARLQAEQLAAELSVQQQRVQEDFTAVRGRLEASISHLTDQLQQREAELAASHRRGGECAETLAFALDDARRELRELQVLRNQEEAQRTSYCLQLEEQLTDLTTRLMERERVLVQRDQELAELHQRSVHFATTDQVVQHLEENLAATAITHQAERESWLAEKSTLESRASDSEAARLLSESQWNALEAQRCILETQRNESETELGNLQVQHEELQSRFNDLENKFCSLVTEYSDLRAECNGLKDQRSELESQIARAQEAARGREELESQLAQLRGRLEQVVDQEATLHAANEEKIRGFELQVERWQSEAHKWQLQAEEAAGQLVPLQQRCAELQLEMEKSQSEASSHVANVAEEELARCDEIRSQLERQRQELAEAQARFQEEQAQLNQLLSEAVAREDVLARSEAELREREANWESARAEQARILEDRAQRLASQIAHFEAEQAAFGQQQATIIQQMSTLEDRVHHLTTASVSRSTNSPFVIPRLDDPALLQDLERAEQPYVRPELAQASEGSQTFENSQNESMDAGEPTESNRALMEDATKLAQEAPPSSPSSFLGEAAEAVRQEDSAGATGHPRSTGAAAGSQNVGQSAGTPFPTGNDDDDDSIEEYMNRLLSRVRGSESSARVDVASQNPRSTSAASSPTRVPAETGNDSSEPKEYVPRAHVPEPSERLSLMRALANTAAESAIQAHARQSQKREIKRKSLVALLSLFGATSLFVAGFYTGSTTALVGSLVFIAVCSVMSMRAISSSLRRKSPSLVEPVIESEAVAEPPPSDAV